jgi:hypothetical protein
MNAPATLVIGAGHHPANHRPAIPARVYESGSGHGRDAAPAGHPHPGPARRHARPGATNPMPCRPRPSSAPGGPRQGRLRRRQASAPRLLTRAAARTTGAATRTWDQTGMPGNRGRRAGPATAAVASSAATQEHAPGPGAVHLRDPGCPADRVVAGGMVGDDPGHERPGSRVLAELCGVEIPVDYHYPAKVARLAQRPDHDLRWSRAKTPMPSSMVPLSSSWASALSAAIRSNRQRPPSRRLPANCLPARLSDA